MFVIVLIFVNNAYIGIAIFQIIEIEIFNCFQFFNFFFFWVCNSCNFLFLFILLLSCLSWSSFWAKLLLVSSLLFANFQKKSMLHSSLFDIASVTQFVYVVKIADKWKFDITLVKRERKRENCDDFHPKKPNSLKHN